MIKTGVTVSELITAFGEFQINGKMSKLHYCIRQQFIDSLRQVSERDTVSGLCVSMIYFFDLGLIYFPNTSRIAFSTSSGSLTAPFFVPPALVPAAGFLLSAIRLSPPSDPSPPFVVSRGFLFFWPLPISLVLGVVTSFSSSSIVCIFSFAPPSVSSSDSSTM